MAISTAEDMFEAIVGAFPARAFNGSITPSGQESESHMFSDFLGNDWRSLDPQKIADHPDGLSLLSDAAFVAFLPAWMTRSLNPLNASNEVMEMTLYCLSCVAYESQPIGVRNAMENWWVSRVSQLTVEQIGVISEFAGFVLRAGPTEFASAARDVQESIKRLWLRLGCKGQAS